MRKLTKRQQQVLEGLMNGASNAEMAKALGISEPMVKKHLVKLYMAKGIHDRIGLVVREYQRQMREANDCIIDAYLILRRIAKGSIIHKKLKSYLDKWRKK